MLISEYYRVEIGQGGSGWTQFICKTPFEVKALCKKLFGVRSDTNVYPDMRIYIVQTTGTESQSLTNAVKLGTSTVALTFEEMEEILNG